MLFLKNIFISCFIKEVLVVILTLFLFSSCETEVDLVGKGEEKIIVYGLFNVKDSIHYLKINKTFNGQGDAYEMAKIEDSTIIKDVQVVVNNTNFDTCTIFTKKPGSFSNPKQLLYRNYEPVRFNSGTTIRLTVKDWKTNKEVIAVTEIVDSLEPDEFKGPHPNNAINNWVFIKWEEPPQPVLWKKPNNAYFVQVRFLINYIEIDKNNNITEHQAPWYIGSTISNSNSTNFNPLLRYRGRDLYITMKYYIESKPGVIRYFGTKNNPNKHFTVQLLAGNKVLYEFMQLNSLPSSDYSNQELYQFTNIVGGLGMIGSFSISERHHLFSPASADSILTHPFTSNLNFQRPIYP